MLENDKKLDLTPLKKAKLEMALKFGKDFLELGLSVEKVAQKTGLLIQEIMDLQKD